MQINRNIVVNARHIDRALSRNVDLTRIRSGAIMVP